jgi:hypothetical protein
MRWPREVGRQYPGAAADHESLAAVGDQLLQDHRGEGGADSRVGEREPSPVDVDLVQRPTARLAGDVGGRPRLVLARHRVDHVAEEAQDRALRHVPRPDHPGGLDERFA